MEHKDAIIQDLKDENKNLTEELDQLKKQKEASDTNVERLTKRIPTQDGDLIVFTKGKYQDTTAGEMTSDDIRMVLRKLAEYEDLEEQGLLLKLPCAIGSTIYQIAKVRSIHWKEDVIVVDDEGEWKVYEQTFRPVFIYDVLKELGKTIFLTEQEAQAELEKIVKAGGE